MSVVLFRKELSDEGEYEICQEYFGKNNVVNQRTNILRDELVIGRYSVLPYYQELENDIAWMGGKLINSYKQHKWIADFEYYQYLKDFTPLSWKFSCEPFYDDDGPFVVKGCTNSKKWQWNTLMYAANKKTAIKIAAELMSDSYIGSQQIYIRKYIPLKTYEIGINNVRFTNEWRVFCYKDQILSKGYYWSCAGSEIIEDAEWNQDADNLIQTLLPIVSKYTNFYTLDIAQTTENKWILIEINDGQMSGLSENNPRILYNNLAKIIK